MRLAARTLHPPLKVGGGPVFLLWTGKKEPDNFGFGLRNPTGRNAFLQVTIGLVAVVQGFAVGHLRSLCGLLKNDNEPDAFISSELKFLVDNSKTAAGRKQGFLF